MLKFCIFLLGLFTFSFANEEQPSHQPHKERILFLLQSKKTLEAISAYEEMVQITHKHDYDILEEMAQILLQNGLKSESEEEKLLSLYGISICGISTFKQFFEWGILNQNPMIQAATIQLLNQFQEDFSSDIIFHAMHSKYFITRMEAAFYLAHKKHPSAIGQIESLMFKLPKPAWVYFPELFAQIGSKESIQILEKLMTDEALPIRISATLSAAKYKRDDLLSSIRAMSTHSDNLEQEASAYALGCLKDLKSIDRLKQLALSPNSFVKLAAAHALCLLGLSEHAKEIELFASAEQNLFAITLLSSFSECANALYSLMQNKDPLVQLNAAISLLRLRDGRCTGMLKSILLNDSTFFCPYSSPARCLSYWKAFPALSPTKKNPEYEELEAISLSFKEQILIDCLELPEESFIMIAKAIFAHKKYPLIPLLAHLLENLHSDKAIALLQEKAEETGAPLIRCYCNLALYRMQLKGENERQFLSWVSKEKGNKVVEFRPNPPLSSRMEQKQNFFLTPEETSRLLIESFLALAERHDPISIDTLLHAIKEGNPKNRSLLAGILLKAIQ